MEHVYHIRYERMTKEKSLRAIAKESGHTFRTVRKYAQMENFNQTSPVKKQRQRKREKYVSQVRSWLMEDQLSPRKQSHTAKKVHERLKEIAATAGKTLDISERTVRTLVSEIKHEIQTSELASLPLIHPAGEAQLDFGETIFYENEQRYTGKHLVISYPHSNARYVQLFKGENTQCLFEGMRAIFEHVGGVPSIIRFDNMSTAVSLIKGPGKRVETEGMLRFKCHYGFESVYCNPAKANEKGSVENAVGYTRRNLFVPVPKFDNLVEYNKTLLFRCDKELEALHYKKRVCIAKLFEIDKNMFKPLPTKAFEAVRYAELKTDNYGFVSFENNKYSTGGNYRKNNVILAATAHNVEISTLDGKLIVTHPRLYEKYGESMKWGPYLKVLAQRPTAIKYSGFYDSLGSELKSFFDGLEYAEQKAVMGSIAAFAEERELSIIINGMKHALPMSNSDSDSFISALGFNLNLPVDIPKNKVPQELTGTQNYTLDFKSYANLMCCNTSCAGAGL